MTGCERSSSISINTCCEWYPEKWPKSRFARVNTNGSPPNSGHTNKMGRNQTSRRRKKRGNAPMRHEQELEFNTVPPMIWGTLSCRHHVTACSRGASVRSCWKESGKTHTHTHSILRSVSFLNCELVQNQYLKPGGGLSDVVPQCIYSEKVPQENPGGGGALPLQEAAAELGEMATVSHDLLQSLPLFGTIASWSLGVHAHRREWEINLEASEPTETPKQGFAEKGFGGFLCVQWPMLIIVWNFFFFVSFKGILFLFCIFFFFFCQTKHAAYIVYAVRVTSWGRGKWQTKKDASSARRSHPRGGRDAKKRIPLDILVPPDFSRPPSVSSLLYNHVFHCVRLWRAAEACCSYKALRSCDWRIGLLVPLYVFGDSWINKSRRFLSFFSFLFFVLVL